MEFSEKKLNVQRLIADDKRSHARVKLVYPKDVLIANSIIKMEQNIGKVFKVCT